jgi:hypothetical protein
MRRPTIVSAGVDTRLVHVLARMAMHVLDTVSAVSGSTTLGRSEARTPEGTLRLSHSA